MSKMIQIRHVPDELHRELKARAARAGQSLSEFLLAELRRLAARPTLEAMRARIRARGAATATLDSAQAVREERERAP